MARSRLCAVAAALVILLLSTGAAADDAPAAPPTAHLRLNTPMLLTRGDGATRMLPPGHFFDEPSYDKIEKEVKRLQDQETRLTAENLSLRKATEGWTPGWKTVASIFVTGVTIGIYVATR